MHISCRHSHEECVEYLLNNYKPDFSITNHLNETSLDLINKESIKQIIIEKLNWDARKNTIWVYENTKFDRIKKIPKYLFRDIVKYIWLYMFLI